MSTTTKHTQDKRTVIGCALIALAAAILLIAAMIIRTSAANAEPAEGANFAGGHPLAQLKAKSGVDTYVIDVKLEGLTADVVEPAYVSLVDSDGYQIGENLEVTSTARFDGVNPGTHYVNLETLPVTADGAIYTIEQKKFEVDTHADATVTFELTAKPADEQTDEELAESQAALEAAGADYTVITTVIETRQAEAQAQAEAEAQAQAKAAEKQNTPVVNTPSIGNYNPPAQQNTQSQPQSQGHTHNWVRDVRNVWHDDEYDTRTLWVCDQTMNCSLGFTTEAEARAHKSETGHGFHTEIEKIIHRCAGYYSEIVTVCSGCGATK